MTYDKKALQELKGRIEDGSVALSDFHSCFTTPYDESSPEIANKAIHAYGGSLDAAISLIGAVLPKKYWGIEEFDGAFTAWLLGPKGVRQNETTNECKGRALLLAILSALIEGEKE